MAACIVNTQYLSMASDTASASVATKQKTERLAAMKAIFTHLNNDPNAGPPVVSATSYLVLDSRLKQDTIRAYNEALVTVLEATHYLGHTASVTSNGGYTEYMAAYFVHCFYQGTLLQSIGKAARAKTGTSVAFHIPLLDVRTKTGSLSKNTNHVNTVLMGEVAQNISAVLYTVKGRL